LAAALPASKAQLEVENSGASNFATSFEVGRENYGTKMAATRRDLTVGALSGGMELVICKFLFR
jgi:hypothetical protein